MAAAGCGAVHADGAPIDDGGFEALGAGEYERAWVLVAPGTRTLSGDAAFGATIYNLGPKLSYGCPAGLGAPPAP